MSRTSVTVPAKINLHLQVLGARADGYHEVWTLFQSIDLFDEVVIETRPSGDVTLVIEPAGSAPLGRDNLVMKAVSAFRERTGKAGGVEIRLRKRIPVGAGLGGGSADAAAALVALDRLWGTRLAHRDFVELASEVGSDAAFFLYGGFALGRGRGDDVVGLPDPPSVPVVVVLPDLEVSTPWAFAELARRLTSCEPDDTVEAFVAGREDRSIDALPWRALFNDFEEVVTGRWPQIGRVLRAVRATGSRHAALTGSGAAVFGVYADPAEAGRAAGEIGREWRVHVGSTLGRRRAGLLGDRIVH